jgi:hypothetical protein
MIEFILDPLLESLQITSFVFLMMVGIDFFNVKVKGRLQKITGNVGLKQYIITNFLGATPGCFGSFMNVSLYMHGTISFGAVAGSMIATSGDEAFVMIAQLGWTAFFVFLVLFFLGIIGSFLADFMVKKLKLEVCVNCKLQKFHEPLEHKPGHYLKDHVWNHIFKNHIRSIFLWTLGALFVVHLLEHFLNLEQITQNYMIYILLIAALIGLIPDSGPHLIFVSLFASGVIPFSVLITSSIVQDGHGLLPLVAFSFKDTSYIKIFNLFFGLIVGACLFYLGF